MKNIKKTTQLVTITMGCLFFSIVASITSCTKDARTKAQNFDYIDTLTSTERVEMVEILYTDSGLIKAKIKAPLMVGKKDEANPFLEMPKGLSGEFYNSDKKPESYITANYGISYEKRKKMEVRNNVVVKNVKGETLQTEKLVWDQVTEKIYTDKPVKITTADEILYGTGMEANQDFTEWYIKKVTGSIKLNNGNETK